MFECVFTAGLSDPYRSTTWTTRTAQIKGADGSVVFTQTGITAPESWSDLAVNIVASKYFYGRGEERENSVKTLIDRVANTIGCWAVDSNYMDLEEAATFTDELMWLLVNQYGAFNSPVWFNCGVTENSYEGNWRWSTDTYEAVPWASEPGHYPQNSACFIQSVDDDMQSIMRLATSEATLFKSGSGTGTDLSTLRSSREFLTGGGRPSGPLSFLKIYDAIAGAIKSGGKTRRAAKMNTLRCDHPDILEFIQCKGKEEDKALALIAQGYEANFNGEAYSTVAFQNANLSVGVTDHFMEAAIAGETWTTFEVTTRNPSVQYNASELLDEIATAAWRCGDPGLHFLDTMNYWNTSAASGQLHTTNPCSEFVYLNDTACNLASLNLMKFMRMGRFDTARFRAAVRVFITAQDVIVDHASYPTKKIAENSHKFRPLGLGYANLGSLLMSLGVPYDSDEGRNLAGAITALMHAEATHTSALLAETLNAFEGYAENEEHMKRVLEQHRKAMELGQEDASELTAPIWTEALDVMDEAMKKGEEWGYRNAQVTLLAPTGCVTPDTLLLTEFGLERLREVGDVAGAQWQDVDFRVQTELGPQDATKFFINGVSYVVEVVTSCGYRFRGTPEHRLFGENGWKRMSDLKVGDALMMKGGGLFGAEAMYLSKTAELVGIYMTLGIRREDCLMFIDEPSVRDRLADLCQEVLGYRPRLEGSYLVTQKPYWWPQRRPWVPDWVLNSNSRDVYSSFIAGVECLGVTISENRDFIADCQAMALTLGVVSQIGQTDDKQFWTLEAKNYVGEKLFLDEVVSVKLLEHPLATFDISVPTTKSYIANGFVSHNTIGFMMDCDTTGVEPDIALVKYKSLAGGGTLKIVNRTVQTALKILGYGDETAKGILEYLEKNDKIEGAPGLKSHHLAVFDCAFPPSGGGRSIAWKGHVKMMAAVQPFLSGAISKCVTGDTRIVTTDGIIRIGTLYQNENPDSFRDITLEVPRVKGVTPATSFYYGGRKPTFKVTLSDGREICGTDQHRLRAVVVGGELGWKALPDLKPGMCVALQLGSECWGVANPPTVAVPGRVPTTSSFDLGMFLGLLTAHGHIAPANHVVGFTKNCPETLDEFKRLLLELFDLEGQVGEDDRYGDSFVEVCSKSLCEWLTGVGFFKKGMPDWLLQAPRETLRGYLSGLYVDSWMVNDTIYISFKSPTLLDDVQAVWDNFGIQTTTVDEWDVSPGGSVLKIVETHARRAAEMIHWVQLYRAERIETLAEVEDKTPFPIRVHQLREAVRNAQRTTKYRDLFDQRLTSPPRETACAAAREVGFPFTAEEFRYRYVPVSKVEVAGVEDVYDISVPETETFIGNGIVNHNTVNMPADSTPKDIRDAYIACWKLGLKAVAVYRDGSKGSQPLNTKQVEEAKKAERERLPDERPSITHKFDIQGHEGYVTVGLYPDGRPGELFITMSKEGSTIGGLMDAFGTAVSVGLQHGVPLQTLVDKFIHTRFEPSGFTKNPNIPIAKSIADYIFRWLDQKFAPKGEETPKLEAPAPKQIPYLQTDAPACPSCGSITVRNASCYRCMNCGESLGCS